MKEMKHLLICPVCKEKGIQQVLAEIKENKIIIKRFHMHETNVIARSYAVQCGNCGEVVFFKEEHERSGDWTPRIYR